MVTVKESAPADWRIEIIKLENSKVKTVRSFSLVNHHDLDIDVFRERLKEAIPKIINTDNQPNDIQKGKNVPRH